MRRASAVPIPRAARTLASAVTAALALVATLIVVPAGSVAADTLTAREALAALVRAPESAPSSPRYSRGAFRHWIDADRNCRNTRAEVLTRSSTIAVTGRCTILRGSWTSSYDGLVTDLAARLDVDHMVPLKEAWDSGAAAWSADARTAYANDLGDPRSLVAVSSSSNRSKSDRDPAEWLPALEHCGYAQAWVAVKWRWSLTVDDAEHAALAALLAGGCGDATLTVTRAP
jgi:hypothetical protein